MKKLIQVLFTIVIAANANAQVTLEHTYITKANLLTYKMNSGDIKIVEYINGNQDSGAINIYNANHSLYKSILLPKDNGTSVSVTHISDQLFNSDSKIEFVTTQYNNVARASRTVVFNEDTARLFDADSCRLNSIYKDNAGYKMILNVIKPGPGGTTIEARVYSLPGTMPLMVKPTEQVNKPLNIADPFPNPAVNEKVIIPYALPEGTDRGDIIFTDLNGREVKTFTVTNTFNTLELDGQLPHGTYFYQLKAGSVTTGAKKLIVIK